MLVREGNKIVVKKRVNELFGGRIGLVNGTREDADNLAKDMRKVWPKNKLDLVNVSQGNTFALKGSFVDLNSKKFYILDIKEMGKSKICVYLYEDLGNKDARLLSKETGLILSNKRIIDVIHNLLKKQGIDEKKMISPKQKSSDEFEDARKRWSEDTLQALQYEKDKQRKLQKDVLATAKKWADKKDNTQDVNISKIVYNKDFLADTGYSRLDMDPYSTSWV